MRQPEDQKADEARKDYFQQPLEAIKFESDEKKPEEPKQDAKPE